jgi:hypothetical protein
MSRSGGTTSRAEASPISNTADGGTAGVNASGRQHDLDLDLALDRLSHSLERIERLLGELRVARLPQFGRPPTTASPAAPSPSQLEDALVIHGGGPSAFARR